jgi:hypothetical protein
MSETTINRSSRVGFFSTAAQADQAVRNLCAVGFTRDQIGVICPQQCAPPFAVGAHRAERPGSHTGEAIVEGSIAGAVVGGIALAATAIATGGVGLLAALPVLVGGGAIAGGYSSLIVSDGYDKGIGEYTEEAVQTGTIVVGVEVDGAQDDPRLTQAERILMQCGGELPTPKG